MRQSCLARGQKWQLATCCVELAERSRRGKESSGFIGRRRARRSSPRASERGSRAHTTRTRRSCPTDAAEQQSDQKFLERLEFVRLERMVPYVDWQCADAAYSSAFREFGIDPDRLEPAEAGRLLSQRTAPSELAFYLDDWALVRAYAGIGRNDDGPRLRLVAALKAADPDPWRNALRERRTGWDGEAKRLANDQKTLTSQSAQSLLLLARTLQDLDQDLARRVLKLAWCLYPSDFWICYELGNLHEPRFSMAAVALRPASAATHFRLASSLLPPEIVEIWTIPDESPFSMPESIDEASFEYRQATRIKPGIVVFHKDLAHTLFFKPGNQEEAVQEYREAIRLDPDDSSGAQTHFAFAADLYRAGRRDEAIAEFREFLRVDRHSRMDMRGH